MVSIRQCQNVIVCVTDADGRLEPDVLEKVLPLFSSRSLGAVQVGVRLAALESVEGPWTRSLAEDLDLGLRMHLEAWRIKFCSATSVHQQGIVSLLNLAFFANRRTWWTRPSTTCPSPTSDAGRAALWATPDRLVCCDLTSLPPVLRGPHGDSGA